MGCGCFVGGRKLFHCTMLWVLQRAYACTTTWISSSIVVFTSLNEERGTLDIAFHVAC